MSDRKKKEILYKLAQIACVVLLTVLLGGICSRKIYLTLDNFCSFDRYYEVFAYGRELSYIGSVFNINTLFSLFCYKIFGHSLFSMVLIHVFPLILALFAVSYVASVYGKKVYWLSFPLLFFILVPLNSGDSSTWMYHQWEALTFMLFLLILDGLVIHKRSKKRICIGLLLSVFIILYGTFITGSILVIVYAAAPALVYALLYYIQSKGNSKKYLKWILTAGIFIFFILSASGLNDWVYDGYGGSAYMGWSSVNELFNQLMMSLKYVAEGYGIEYSGQSLIQGWTLLYMAKYSFFFFALYLCVKYTIQGIKDCRNINPIIFLSCLCAVFNLMANVIGTCIYSDPDRYFSGIHYALAILVCQHIGNLLFEEGGTDSIKIQAKRMSASVLCLCILALSMYMEVEKIDKIEEADYHVAQYLLENDLHYGMGDFYNIYASSVFTDGEVEGFLCFSRDGGIEEHFSIPVSYYEGSCQYRYLYDSYETFWGWDEESIGKFYGDFINVTTIDDRTRIYVYDYDIRWQQIMLGPDGRILSEGKEYYPVYKIEPFETVKYTFDLPIGISRITLHGDDVQKLQVEITGNESVFKIVDKAHGKGKISYDISCGSLTPVQICLTNSSEEQVNFSYLDLRMVYAARDLVRDQTIGGGEELILPLDTKESKVRFAVKGERADKLELQAGENSSFVFKKVRAGDVQAIYEVSGISEDRQNDILVKNMTDQQLTIEKISYEHTDFEALYAKQFSYAVHRTKEGRM